MLEISISPHKTFYEPTFNQMGYMTTQIDEIGWAFLDFAKTTSRPIVDIGAAYGHVALEAASRNIPIIVNDLDQRHLNILLERATEEQRPYLTALPGRFPEEFSFQANSLDAILICRVLHFFTPLEWLTAVQMLFQWLAPGGKVFMTNESPYFGTMRSFIPIYLKNKRNGHPWPGVMIGMKYFDVDRKKDVNSTINLLSRNETRAILEDAGFLIEHIGYLDRKGMYPDDALFDGRETVGVIAVKP
jgi:2-polyprenyl-3-methyl-5-hydroxy-6-metoxy-1,4-benzoquinol methylase